MKTKLICILAMVAVFFFVLPGAGAVVEFNDNQTHNIDCEINNGAFIENVEVMGSPSFGPDSSDLSDVPFLHAKSDDIRTYKGQGH